MFEKVRTECLPEFNANNVEDSVKILIDEAKKNGGYDNITAIVIEPQIEEVNEC